MLLNRRIFLSSAAAAFAGLNRARAEPLTGFDPTPFRGITQVPDSTRNTLLDPAIRAGRIAWLEAHAAPLRSIDFADDDFSDLDAFAKAVGNARIVMLGEQTHGDGTTFLAKARLVHFLHRHTGFDVLAFENDLYDVHKAWERIGKGEDARIAAKSALYSIWSHCRQVQPLIDYVGAQARNDNALELAGFDCQFAGVYTQDNLLGDFSAFLAAHTIDTQSLDWPRFKTLFEKLADTSGGRKWRPAAEERDFMLSAADVLLARIAATQGKDASFWSQVFKSIKVFAKLRALDLSAGWPVFVKLFNLRDAGMAENLIWLAREAYPQRKIIVWAAAFHIFRYPDGAFPDGRTNMGTHVWKVFGDAIYNVAFTGYAGKRGLVYKDPVDLAPAPPDSLEGLWGATAQQNAFLDFRHLAAGGEWLDAPFPSRVLAEGNDAETADWSKFLDGVVFLRDMQPAVTAE